MDATLQNFVLYDITVTVSLLQIVTAGFILLHASLVTWSLFCVIYMDSTTSMEMSSEDFVDKAFQDSIVEVQVRCYIICRENFGWLKIQKCLWRIAPSYPKVVDTIIILFFGKGCWIIQIRVLNFYQYYYSVIITLATETCYWVIILMMFFFLLFCFVLFF